MDIRHAMKALLPLALVISQAACGGDDTVVYVPGASFVESLYVTTARGAQVRARLGDPVLLHAQRRSGPWVPVEAGDVEEGQCTSPTLPEQLEIEVADRVTWLIDPQGHATLRPSAEEEGAMEIRFDSVGTYRLTAESPSACGEAFRGGIVVVEVVE